jgi:hypothetical protein
MPKVHGRTPDNIYDALASGSGKSTPAKPAHAGRAKYTSADQKKALKQCDDVVATLTRVLASTKAPADLKKLKVSVDTLGDFPYVSVKKGSVPLFDRQSEIDGLRKLLPASLRGVPLGDVSPY